MIAWMSASMAFRTVTAPACSTCQTLVMTALPVATPTEQDRSFPTEPCVLLKLGEIVLKGRNRQQFERLLQNNIRLAVADLGLGLRLWQRDGVIVLSPTAAVLHTESAAAREAAQAAAHLIAERMLNV